MGFRAMEVYGSNVVPSCETALAIFLALAFVVGFFHRQMDNPQDAQSAL